jgi:hypothetical protein
MLGSVYVYEIERARLCRAAVTIRSGVTGSPITARSSTASSGQTGSPGAGAGQCCRSFDHWEISQFWQFRHRRLQPTVAME